MTPRTDTAAATRLDIALLLLPQASVREVASMLARHHIPIHVALRVLTTRAHRA